MNRRDNLDALYRQHMKSIYYYLYKVCGNAQLAEDFVQETFVRATISLNEANPEHARAWLFQVARNVYLDEWRKQERRKNNPLFQLFLRQKEMISPYGEPEQALLAAEHEQILESVLKQLPEGTVAEFKFTTTDYMTPEQLLKKLERYDLHVLWMPLFTGEFERFTPNMYGTGDGGITSYDSIGFYGGDSHADDQFGSRASYTQLQSDRIAESEDMYLTNMAELLGKGQSYYEHFLGVTYLPERYEYLQTNGFKVYGAVVTGPTKELLKLREEAGIHEVQLGDVELWNWEQVE